MLPVRLLAALAAVFCLSACALPVAIPGVPQAPEASQSVEDEAEAEEPDTDEPDAGPTSAPTEDWTPYDVSGIQSRGADSKECAAATALGQSASTIAMSAATGGVTQEMYDRLFVPSTVNDIPSDAGAALDAFRTATKALIGNNPLESEEKLEAWTYAFLDWQQVMFKICT